MKPATAMKPNTMLATTVAELLDSTRQQGHTRLLGTVMAAGPFHEPPLSPPRCIFASASEAADFASRYHVPRERCLSVSGLPFAARVQRGPILADLHVLRELAAETLRLSNDLERTLSEARRREEGLLSQARQAEATAASLLREVLDLRAKVFKSRAKQRKTAASLRRARSTGR